MKKAILLSFLFVFYFITSYAQSGTESAKECRISGGIGFAGAINSPKSVGPQVWLQLGYKLSKNVSIAMEFENMGYSVQGFYPNMPKDLDGVNVVGNNFSLLFKYHVDTKLPLKLAVGSGWTYTLKTSDYYYYGSTNSMQDLRRHISTDNNYEVPLLLEVLYPIWKAVDIQARVKGSLNAQKQSTYSSGIGLSIRL